MIQNGQSQQLVYYWFEQRGQRFTNDFIAKLWVVWDSLIHDRTDGALVRFVTPIEPGEPPAAADARIQALMTEILPRLPQFIPRYGSQRLIRARASARPNATRTPRLFRTDLQVRSSPHQMIFTKTPLAGAFRDRYRAPRRRTRLFRAHLLRRGISRPGLITEFVQANFSRARAERH
jgi:hypothetical protein